MLDNLIRQYAPHVLFSIIVGGLFLCYSILETYDSNYKELASLIKHNRELNNEQNRLLNDIKATLHRDLPEQERK